MPIDILNDDLQTAMKKLKARENSFIQVEAISNLGSWEIDLKTNKSVWSDQSFKIYGLDKESTEPTLELFLSHVLPEDLSKAKQTLHEAMKTGEVTSFECRVKDTKNNILNILINGQVIFDEDKTPSN